MAARVFAEPEHQHPFRDALSDFEAAGEIALARNALERVENARPSAAASLPAFRNGAGVGAGGNWRGAAAALLEAGRA